MHYFIIPMLSKGKIHITMALEIEGRKSGLITTETQFICLLFEDGGFTLFNR